MPPKPTILTLCCVALVAMTACAAHAAPLSITSVNSLVLPASATDQNNSTFTITGMSGVTRLTDGTFAAIMDNSSKIVRFSLTIDATTGTISAPAMLPSISLASSRDFEGIALIPTGFGPGDILTSDEGVAGSVLPALSRWSMTTGAAQGSLTTPAVYASIRTNRGLESLATGKSPKGLDEAWTANEETLTADGPASSATVGAVVRIQRYLAGAPAQQFAYICDPWHGTTISNARSGLADICLLPDGRLIALERSFAFSGSGFFRTRIYELDFTAATDVASISSLTSATFTPVAKTLLYNDFLQNVEGLCVGPALTGAPAGTFALIAVTDDADPISNNTVFAFRITGVGPAPCPADLNNDRAINTADLTAFLGAFGQSAPPGIIPADLNGDGSVNTSDLVTFLARFGVPCP